MSFEVYKPRGEKPEKMPIVSLSKTSVVLNTVARDKLKTDRIELAYDSENKIIRIRAVDEGGMEIKKTKVFGKGFFNHFNIDLKGKFEAKFNPEERSLYVNIED